MANTITTAMAPKTVFLFSMSLSIVSSLALIAGLIEAYGDQETRLQDNPTERSATSRFLFSCDDVGDVCF
jgi:hypothetical protein